MDAEHRMDKLEEEIDTCKTNLGGKLTDLERDLMVKLTRQETQILAMSATLLTFVNHSQFKPVMLIAYGLAGGVLMTVLGALLAKLLGL